MDRRLIVTLLKNAKGNAEAREKAKAMLFDLEQGTAKSLLLECLVNRSARDNSPMSRPQRYGERYGERTNANLTRRRSKETAGPATPSPQLWPRRQPSVHETGRRNL
jgi:hypothetical protein